MNVPVITIDGPTASGKGTVTARVAAALGWHALDSGALYRLTALACRRQEVSVAHAGGVADVARALDVRFAPESVWLEDDDVSELIRHESIGEQASRLAAYPEVREALLARQRAFRQLPGLVADGRDMGTVVFPEAGLKVFLVASVEARAERRYKQLMDKGIPVKMQALLEDLQARDARDAERAAAPLKPAPDARILDSSELSIDQTVQQVLNWYHT